MHIPRVLARLFSLCQFAVVVILPSTSWVAILQSYAAISPSSPSSLSRSFSLLIYLSFYEHISSPFLRAVRARCPFSARPILPRLIPLRRKVEAGKWTGRQAGKAGRQEGKTGRQTDRQRQARRQRQRDKRLFTIKSHKISKSGPFVLKDDACFSAIFQRRGCSVARSLARTLQRAPPQHVRFG